jgi:hypothetical protein
MLKIVVYINIVLLGLTFIILPIGAVCWYKAKGEAEKSAKIFAKIIKELK